MTDTIRILLRGLSIVIGGASLGLSLSVLIYYIWKAHKKLDLLNLHIITIAISHCLLTYATMTTMWNGLYTNLNSKWYWVTFFGWLLSIFSIIIILQKIRLDYKLLQAFKPHARRDKTTGGPNRSGGPEGKGDNKLGSKGPQ